MEENYLENKYVKVRVASQRAKQLFKGARPRIEAGDLKKTRIAIREVEEGLITFDFVPVLDVLAVHRP
jgi:DNA-directed RNA polymerase omega subunit